MFLVGLGAVLFALPTPLPDPDPIGAVYVTEEAKDAATEAKEEVKQ